MADVFRRQALRGIIERMNLALKAWLLAGGCIALAMPSMANTTSPAAADPGAWVRTQAEGSVGVTAPTSDRLQNMLIHAISLIGVKYKFGGSSAQSGFDCSGFVRHVFAEAVAVELPRSSYAMGRIGLKVETDDLRAGDLVFYNTLHRAFSHVGIYLGEGRFVHAPSRGKSVEIVDMSDNYWKRRFNGARRLLKDD